MAILSVLLLAAAPSSIGYGEVVYCKETLIQAELTACAWDAYKKADQQMNEVWRNLNVKPGRKDPVSIALLKSQRAFLVYRDETCKIPFIRESPGTIAPMEKANCLTEITLRRVTELQKLFR